MLRRRFGACTPVRQSSTPIVPIVLQSKVSLSFLNEMFNHFLMKLFGTETCSARCDFPLVFCRDRSSWWSNFVELSADRQWTVITRTWNKSENFRIANISLRPRSVDVPGGSVSVYAAVSYRFCRCELLRVWAVFASPIPGNFVQKMALFIEP